MIIRYKKKKDHIPKGRLVEVTAEKGKEEIDAGVAEKASEQDYRNYQDKRRRGLQEAEEGEELKEIYQEYFGKAPPKSWGNERIAEELDKKAEEALDEKIKEKVQEQLKDK